MSYSLSHSLIGELSR